MTRLLLALAGVVLLAVTALAAVWLLGQLLTGLGLFIVGAAGVLGRLLWFLLITGVLAGVVYFVASAWRPSVRAPVPPVPAGTVPSSAAPVIPAPAAPTTPERTPTEPVQTGPAPTTAAGTEAAASGPVRSGD
jgi:predicted lipid-binding transport protein (Tim44 family)